MERKFDQAEEYLLFSEFLNVAGEAISSIDEECDEFDITDFDKISDQESDDVDYNEQLDEQLEFDDVEQMNTDDDSQSFVTDILQCIINMIELECMSSKEVPKKRRDRRWGVHPINQMRREQGHFQNLFKEMLLYDHEKFFNYTRMTPERFEHLLELVGPKITKNAPNAIPPECRLLLTLRFLATGDSLKSLHYNFRVGITTAYRIILETCESLWVILMPLYLKFPTEEDWLKIAADFRDKLNFPHCVGALDAKLIEMFAPKRSGSMFFNYMKYFSTNLLAVCDAHKNFVYVDIGSYGKQSDGGIFFHSSFGKRLDSINLNFPPPAFLPHTNTTFPYFIIGDSAFPLKENLLTPYTGNHMNLTDIEANFNHEQSSVRKIIENVFAIFVRRWQVFIGPINMQPKNVEKIVMAGVVLHNYIKSFGDEASVRYMREERYKLQTAEGLSSFYEAGLRYESSRPSERAQALRDVYANYLNIV